MAICEEIERKIVIDDVTLTRFREHLSLVEYYIELMGCLKTAHFSQFSVYGSVNKIKML